MASTCLCQLAQPEAAVNPRTEGVGDSLSTIFEQRLEQDGLTS